jgi:hypothetical protein
MKKLFATAVSVVALIFFAGILRAGAAPYLPVQGGTGTSQIPASGTIPIGNGAGTYTPNNLTAGTGTSITNGSGTVTITNTGVTSFAGQGCVTAANSTGTISLTVSCISGNQTITFSMAGDATGTASGTTAITDAITVIGLNGKSLPANTTGTLQFTGGAWAINLATSSLGIYDPNGNLSSYLGSSCGGGQFVTGFSATGTVACGTPAPSSTLGSGEVGFGSASNTLTGSSTFTFTSSTLYALLIEGIANADEFTGSDIDAKVQNAYNALPSNGGEVFIPANFYSASTTININTPGKVLLLMCPAGGGLFDNGGATINFTGTGSQFTYNVQNFVSAGTGITNCNFIGPAGSGNIGSSTISSSIAVNLGGSHGAFGFQLNNVHISGYGTGVYVGQNTSFIDIFHSVINKNGRAIDNPQTSGANGENNYIGGHSVIADCNSNVGSSIADDCIDVQQSGNVQWTLDTVSLDDAQLASSQFGGTSNVFNLINVHCEDPNTSIGAYDCITTQSSAAGAGAVTINVQGGDMMQDFTSGPPNEFISYGGTLNLTDVTCDINNNVTNPMNDFATPLNNTAIINWNGMSNKGYNTNNNLNTGCTNIYGSQAFSTDGLAIGSSTAVYAASTSTFQLGQKTQVLSNDLEDANGNKYSTSTGSGIATTTPFSSGYLPVITTSSKGLTNSNAYQLITSTTTILTPTSTIAIDATSSGAYNGGATSTLTSSFTVGTSTTNRMLFVGVVGDIGSNNITGVTYAGVSMTLIGTNHNSGDRYIDLYALPNPATGTNNYTVTANDNGLIATVLESFSGVNQTVAMDATSTANVNSSTTLTTSLTTVANNDWSILISRGAVNAATAGASSTLRASNATFQTWDTNGPKTPAGTQSMTINNAGDTMASIMAAFSPVPAVTTTTILSTNIGIGTTTPSTAFDVNGDITDENVKSAPCTGTNATGTITSVSCLTAAPATTTINGVAGPTITFSVVGTSTPSSVTTSTGQVFLNLLQSASGTDISVGTNGVINFINPGFVTSGSSTTWTAAQTFTQSTTLEGVTEASGTQYYALFASSTANASQTTINWNNSNVQELKLTTSTTITFTNTNPGARYILMLLQDGTGSRIVTWSSTVQWAGGTAPTLTTAANKMDITTFVCATVSSTDCYGGANLNYSP